MMILSMMHLSITRQMPFFSRSLTPPPAGRITPVADYRGGFPTRKGEIGVRTIFVGLTGLSRSGKTVFLTSAIHDFVQHTGLEMDEFRFNGWRYVGHPQLLPQGVLPFPQQALVKAFREDPPRWPLSTVDVTEFRIHLQFLHENNRRREGTVVFVDYPGERLVDVALLDTSYEDWSESAWVQLHHPSHSAQAAARDFLAVIQSLQPDTRGAISENKRQVAQHAFGAFCASARKARQVIAPVLPVLLAEQRHGGVCTPFFPLKREDRQRLPKLHRLLKQQYAAYLKSAVSPFLRRIGACSHQIVLVDVLDILRSGTEKYDEIQEQMQRVLHCYRKINRGWLRYLGSKVPLVGRPLIRRVSFGATKADQATRDYRGNLVCLLRELFVKATTALQFDHRTVKKIDFWHVAAHRCTDDVDADHEGKPIVALRGRLQEGALPEEGLYFPGRVPAQWPAQKHEWQAFRFPDFRPRRLPDITLARPLPHLNMDQILFAIVEDLLQ